MAQQTYIKLAGEWKAIKNIWIKIGGSWKYLVKSWVNVNGTWEETMSYTDPPSGATPYIQAGAHTGTKPDGTFTGYTYPKINTSASTPAKCSYVASINQTRGGNTYAFYLGLQGMKGTSEQMCAATANVVMTITHPIYAPIGESVTISSGVSLLNSAKIYISGTLSGFTYHGNVWRYDDVASITITNITYGDYSAC